MAEQPKSRLDRELDEILAKKSREPIEFRSHLRVQEQTASRPDIQRQVARFWQRLAAMPLALAFVLAVAAMMVHDFSPLLALLLNTGAVAALWVPGIRNLRRGSMPTSADVKYWRGQPYTSQMKSAVSRSPIDSLKRYFDRRR